MARVKRAVNAQKKRRSVLEKASGYRGQRSRLYRKAKEQVTHPRLRVPRPSRPQGRLPSPVDPAHQRCRPRRGPDLQPLHPGARPGRRGDRPPHARRAGRQRARGLQGPCGGRSQGPPRGRQRPPRPDIHQWADGLLNSIYRWWCRHPNNGGGGTAVNVGLRSIL